MIKKRFIAICIIGASLFSFSFVDVYFDISKNLEIMSTILRELNSYYVDDIKPGDLMKKGIDEMLQTLDPYTEFYPESEIEDYKVMLTGQYGGIGALIHRNGDNCVVSDPYEGFPAQKNGLMAGDILVEVNGMAIKGKSTTDVSKLLKGQAGTQVKIVVKREGEKELIEKTLTREEIKIKNVPYYGLLTDSIGYIKLTGFTEDAAKEVKDALVALKEKHNIKKLVFDLRGNGGGLLKESVDIVNIFVEKGQLIVSQKGKVKEMNRTHIATKPPVDTQIPLIVLVDKGSASASEIVSGAIQDLDRGVIIGQRSFGKGLVQQTLQLVYNTQMKVTTAKYYTPSGRCIQALDYFHKNPNGTVDKVPDSLMKEFKTKNGRSVFDGSGIYPDLLTEEFKYSSITVSLLSKNLIFDYATKYRIAKAQIDPSRKFKVNDEEYKSFVAFLYDKDYDYTTKSEKLLSDFKETAKKEKYFDEVQDIYEELRKKVTHDKQEDLKKFKDEITEALKNEIVSRYYFQSGRLEASFENDTDIKEALILFGKMNWYWQILAGEGAYKVIGKPSVEKQKLEKKENEENKQSPAPKKENKKIDKKG